MASKPCSIVPLLSPLPLPLPPSRPSRHAVLSPPTPLAPRRAPPRQLPPRAPLRQSHANGLTAASKCFVPRRVVQQAPQSHASTPPGHRAGRRDEEPGQETDKDGDAAGEAGARSRRSRCGEISCEEVVCHFRRPIQLTFVSVSCLVPWAFSIR